MIELEAKFTSDFTEAFKKLAEAAGESTLRAAGYAGAKLLQDTMIVKVPKRKRIIMRNIIIKRDTERSKDNQQQVYLVTVRKGKENVEGDAFYWKWVESGHKYVRRRKPKKGTKTGKETMKAARMASELEYGTARKGAVPFMRPTWESKKREVLDVMRARMRQKIAEYLGKA